MLASERRTPFTHEDFVYEIKYDGWRCLSGADRGRVELRTRNGANCSKWFPEIGQVLAALKGGPHVLDGEAAVLDDIGRSDFNRMHARAAKRRWDPLNPVAYCAFDLLVLNGTSVMDRTYEERKALLFELLAPLKGKLVIVGYPHFRTGCSLLLADKTATASVSGINQMFPVDVAGGRIRVAPRKGVTVHSIGAPLLTKVPLEDVIEEVLDAEVDLGPSGCVPMRAAIGVLAAANAEDRPLPPKVSSCCRKCQFRVEDDDGSMRSGFHECWREHTGLSAEKLQQPLVLDLWNSRRVGRFIKDGRYLLSDLTADDVGHDGAPPDDGGITLAQLHWFQASGRWPGGGAFFLHPALRREMQAWRFPLHFIDFETATVAIPFHEGSRPYETVAFQFSHHVLEADGSARHASQFLHAEPGENPNLHFIRALKASLSHDDGTVFRWHNHENTVLNQIVDMLEAQRSTISDADELIAFALTLIERGDGESRQVGPRAMVDLCALSQKYFYHPLTKGSPSLKKVLPALMSCSERLKQIYSRPTYGQCGEIPSLNFSEPIAWWREDANGVADPYKLLPAVTADAAPGSVLHSLRDGGAAMAAYVRLQFENVQASEREAVKSALLRYCELDTLAMLMAVQAWSAWLPS